MNVVFRVDSSVKMGIGHLMRCLTLANVIDEVIKSNIFFVCRKLPGNINELVTSKGYGLIELSFLETSQEYNETHVEYQCTYEDWLGSTSLKDAEETHEAIKEISIDWLIVDSYGIDHLWEEYLKPLVNKIMVIDDLANRHHVCDLLLDQNYSPNYLNRYNKLISDNCKALLGPEYAILGKEFIDSKVLQKKHNEIPKILLFLSGSDETNLLCHHILEILFDAFKDNIAIDVVVGNGQNNRLEIEHMVAEFNNASFYSALPHLGNLMSQADIAIGSGGVTTWERMFMGLPSIVISLSDNQLPACIALSEDEYIYYLGHRDVFDKHEMLQTILMLINKPDERDRISIRCQQLVDGRGAYKIVNAMLDNFVNEL